MEIFGRLPSNIVVTGATGFLGGRLISALSKNGAKVRALGRNLARGMALEGDGIVFRPVALDDYASLVAAFNGAQAVVHAAGLSSPWASKADFELNNVLGTRCVIDAARRTGVDQLIYISSPSVISRQYDQHRLREGAPPPKHFLSEYSTKQHAHFFVCIL